jgi:hypothetical protein
MWVENVEFGVSVVNVLVVVLVTPSSVAVAVTVYFCDTPSAHLVCHDVLAAFIEPGTGPAGLPLVSEVPPTGVTVTLFSVPLPAVTVTPPDGSALAAPLAGEIVTAAAFRVGLGLAVAPAPEPGEPPLALPPFAAGLAVSLRLAVHAVASIIRTTVAAAAPSRLVVIIARTRMHPLSRRLPS